MRLGPALGLLLVASLLPTPTANADWAAFHNDALSTGFVSPSSYQVFEDVWWSNTTIGGAQIQASPVVKDGIVIIADLNGLVRALDGESGYEYWRHKMPKGVAGTPAISGERVYVVDVAGNLKALNLEDGKEEVKAAAAIGPTHSGIRQHQGKIFVGTDKGEVKAFFETTLAELWTFDTGQIYTERSVDATTGAVTCSGKLTPLEIYGTPTVYAGKVFFGSLNHWFFAVDEPGTGFNQETTLAWYYQTGDLIYSSPSVIERVPATGTTPAESLVAVGSYDGKMYGFNALQAAGTMLPCNKTDTKCVMSKGCYLLPSVKTCGTAAIACKWAYEIPRTNNQVAKIHTSPANNRTHLYFGANNGNMYALKAADGTLLWTNVTGNVINPVISSPAVANGIVMVGSADTLLYWFDALTGKRLKTFDTRAAIETSPAIDGTNAYIASKDGTAFMLGPDVPPRPDIVVTLVTATAQQVKVDLMNVGTAAATNSTTRLQRDDGVFVADVDTPGMEAGAAVSIVFKATTTAPIAPVTKRVSAFADWSNDVKEADEGNNGGSQLIAIKAPRPGSQTTAPPAATTTEAKKSPDAGVALIGVLVLVAFAARRRLP